MAKAPHFDGTQACSSMDPEAFFPEGSNAAAKAKKELTPVCLQCNFYEPCLKYALHNDVQGIWAATTDTDRKMLRRKAGIKDVNYMYLSIDRLTR